MPEASNETPESLVRFCQDRQDAEKGAALYEAYRDSVVAHRTDFATQIAFMAYVLAEMELSAPQSDLLMPALAQLVAQNVRTLRLVDAAPAGAA